VDICRHLRWKSYTRDAEDLDEFEVTFARNQVPYTCLRTCQPWGPDEELAVPEGCNGARACYERSPLAPPLRDT
jgi:hypothetical protein